MAVRARSAVLPLLLALTIGPVAACSDDAGGGSAEPTSAPTPTETPTEDAPDTATASPSPTAPQTTVLDTGHSAPVPLSAGRRSGEVEVAVMRVRRGRIQHLSDFVLDRRSRRSTPYYADVRVVNRSNTNLGGANVALWGLDSSDTVLPPAEIRGSFARCQNSPLPQPFGHGARARVCLLYLVPPGERLVAVQYRFADGSTLPISWPVR